MSPEVAALRSRTPVTEAFVRYIRAKTGEAGLNYEDNKRAYWWRMFEDRHPRLMRLVAVFVFGPLIAAAPRYEYRADDASEEREHG